MLHILYVIILIALAYILGYWRNWEKYYPTALFFAFGNLLYHFVSVKHYLWRFHSTFLSDINLELIHLFTIYPATTLTFLGMYFSKNSIKGKLFTIICWIGAYGLGEYLLYANNQINYYNGWNFMYSILFLPFMFFMLILHHKKPLYAYVIAFIVFVFGVFVFDIPLNTPVEDR